MAENAARYVDVILPLDTPPLTFLLPDGDSLKRRPPDRVLMSAIKAARLDALKSGRDLSLYYNKLGYFSVCDTETAVEKFKLWLNPKKKDLFEKAEKEGSHLDDSDFPNDVEIEFYQIYPEVVSSSILSFSEEPLKCLRFSADSSMTHAKIVVRDGGGEIGQNQAGVHASLRTRRKIRPFRRPSHGSPCQWPWRLPCRLPSRG